MSLPKELRVPLWSWILRIFGLCGAVFFFGFSIWMLGQAKHPLGWSPFVIIMFRIVISAATDVRNAITMSRTLVTEAGLQVKNRKQAVFFRWEDVVRYESYGKEFALHFKNGEKIRFLMEAKNFKEIKNIVLEKIESIGTFEDGRKVPRELPSISIKFLLWMFAVIVIVVVAIVLLK